MCLLSEVCLPERKKERRRRVQEILLLFVVCRSLSVVCRSFERNGNACLFVCLFVSSFRLQVLAGSCRGDACPQAATISATTTHPLWYLTTTCCRLGRACMASMTCATITGKDFSVSLSLSLYCCRRGRASWTLPKKPLSVCIVFFCPVWWCITLVSMRQFSVLSRFFFR